MSTIILNTQVITGPTMYTKGRQGDPVMDPEWIQWFRSIQERVGGSSSDLISSDGAGGTLKLTAGAGITITITPTQAIVSGSGVTSVNVSGDDTGLIFSGGPITTHGTITIGGVLGIAHGGTDATDANDALNNLLPPQTGYAGSALVTDGVNTSWGGAPTDIVSTMAYAGTI